MITDTIEKTVRLRAPRSRVWRAISDSEEFGLWFGVKFERPFEAGARMRAVIVPTTVDPEVAAAQKKYQGTPFEITVEQIQPERLFSFRWHPGAVDPDVDYSVEPTTLVVFELTDADGGTQLTITESGFDQIPLARRAKAFASNEGGWTGQMRLISLYLSSLSDAR
jgi:uncharacterized protein YndB with AHSA1/START domain